MNEDQITIDIGTSAPKIDNILKHTKFSHDFQFKEKQTLTNAKHSQTTDERMEKTDFIKYEPRISPKASHTLMKTFLPSKQKKVDAIPPSPENLLCCGAVKEFLTPSQSLAQLAALKSLPWSVSGKELAHAARLLIIKKEKPSL